MGGFSPQVCHLAAFLKGKKEFVQFIRLRCRQHTRSLRRSTETRRISFRRSPASAGADPDRRFVFNKLILFSSKETGKWVVSCFCIRQTSLWCCLSVGMSVPPHQFNKAEKWNSKPGCCFSSNFAKACQHVQTFHSRKSLIWSWSRHTQHLFPRFSFSLKQ